MGQKTCVHIVAVCQSHTGTVLTGNGWRVDPASSGHRLLDRAMHRAPSSGALHPRRADPLGFVYPRSGGPGTRARTVCWLAVLRSADPVVRPIVDTGFFADPDDLPRFLEGIRLARRLARTEPLSSLVIKE